MYVQEYASWLEKRRERPGKDEADEADENDPLR